MNMPWRKTSTDKNLFYPVALIMVLLVCGGAFSPVLTGCDRGEAEEMAAPPDIIMIDAMAVFGDLERPAVQFPHDRHTRALGGGAENCTQCHPERGDGYLSLKFKRLENTDRDEVMKLYHDECQACHKTIAAEDKPSGPVTCGDCHDRAQPAMSTWIPMGFDNSLHTRHIRANGDDCGLCHHVYDEEKKELVYMPGTESSCRDCHIHQSREGMPSHREASHLSCLSCHRLMAGSGPIDCAGCHDRERRAEITTVTETVRLRRGQPDFVLLSAPGDELTRSKLRTVPFSHVGHEGFNNTCRVCHHESMRACKECHTLAGSESGGGVTLQRAMHAMGSEHSCVGCHEVKKSDGDCAGCHSLMEQGRLSEHACTICHAGPEPERWRRCADGIRRWPSSSRGLRKPA